MASFPDLRPRACLVSAKCRAARSIGSPVVLLRASAAVVSIIAFVAVSELATLRGHKASVRTSVLLARELGSRDPSSSLVRRPTAGTSVRFTSRGYIVRDRGLSLELNSPISASTAWRRFMHGVQRDAHGTRQTLVVRSGSTEELLTVRSHHDRTVWRWRLSTSLQPRVSANGVVGFFNGPKLAPLGIEAVKILDANGNDVTPRRAHWSVARRRNGTWLELALDDHALQTPYTIDPTISWRAAGAVATSAGTSIAVGIPAAARAQDLLLMHIVVNSASAPTTPTGWT